MNGDNAVALLGCLVLCGAILFALGYGKGRRNRR